MCVDILDGVCYFCLVHCFSSSLPSCMDLSFAEIVNQLNALSCLHGDDDDDGGVPKRARKATAKPAASSQGLFSTFLSPLFIPRFFLYCLVNIVLPLPTSQCHSLYLHIYLFFIFPPIMFCLPLFLSLFGSTLPYPLILRDIGIVVVLCGTIYLQSCGDVQYVVLWTHQLVFILLVPIVSLIWQCDLSHSFTAIGSEPNQVKRKEKPLFSSFRSKQYLCFQNRIKYIYFKLRIFSLWYSGSYHQWCFTPWLNLNKVFCFSFLQGQSCKTVSSY